MSQYRSLQFVLRTGWMMRPLDPMRCSSSISNSILKLTVIPLLAFILLEGTLFPLRAATASHRQLTPAQKRATQVTLKRPNLSQAPPTESDASEVSPSDAVEPTPPSDPTVAPDADSETTSVTVPKSSAIVVSFPAEIMLDPKRQNNVPITLPLVRPIVDQDGNIVVPAKSLVSAQLKPMKGGDLIEVIAVVIGGQVIPINAIGTLVPAQKKPEDFSNQYVPNPGPLNNVFNSLANWQLSSNYLNLNRNALLNDYIGVGLAIANGLTTPKPKEPPAYVNISQGTIYILTLATSFSVPRKLVDAGLQMEQNAEANGGT